MHDFYATHQLNKLQKQMFERAHRPAVAMSAFDAHNAFIRNDVELVPLTDIKGRIAMEGALPYPPGVYCIVPGEVRDGAVLDYFLALQEGVNSLPGFEPEVQGRDPLLPALPRTFFGMSARLRRRRSRT